MINHILVGIIRTYQYGISPLLGPRCRYYPTCSAYAIDALKQHGTIKGISLSVRRIARCHPGCEGGYDPVPQSEKK